MNSLPVNLTLVLYPTSPRDIALHILQKDNPDANSHAPSRGIFSEQAASQPEQSDDNSTESGEQTTGKEETGNTPPEGADQPKKRTRRTRQQIEADKLAKLQSGDETGDDSSGSDDSDEPVTVSVTHTPVTSPEPTPLNPEKETDKPAPPVSPEHAEPAAPAGQPSPSELPRPEQQNLLPYSHATTEQRRALLSVINHVTGMQFQVWKNTPAIYDVVKKFQSELEGTPSVIADPRGGVSLAPFVAENFRKAVSPVLEKVEEDTY